MSLTKLQKFKIIFLDSNPVLCQHFTSAIEEYNNKLNRYSTHIDLRWFNNCPVELSVINGTLDNLAKSSWFGKELVPSVKYTGQPDYSNIVKSKTSTTTIMSPGNSFGYMGGGFDLALADWFSSENGHNSWKSTEKYVQEQLLKGYHGYLTPSNANLIEFNSAEFYRVSKAWNLTNANSILHLPTMRVPRRLFQGDDRSRLAVIRFVFDCTWELLSTINKANLSTLKYRHPGDDAALAKHSLIDTAVFTGIGTGYGELPCDLVAKSMFAAISIFLNSGLEELEKSVYCLKFLKEDYRRIIKIDDTLYSGVKFDSDYVYDPLLDPLYKLY